MSYEQSVLSQILSHEQVLADIRAGRVFWCETCECWVPIGERREDPFGSEWPICIDCLQDSGLPDTLVSDDEYNEHLRIPPWKPQREKLIRKRQNNADH